MTPAQTAFAQELIAYWISFVRTHDPSTFKLERSPTWPRFSAKDTERMVLQMNDSNSTDESGSTPETQDQDETGRCAFLASIAGEMED
jgi:carboxylesterase type B